MKNLLNELKALTGDKTLYIDNGGNILVKYKTVEFLIHKTDKCENLYTILVDEEKNDKHYLEYNQVLLLAKEEICRANRQDTEKFNLTMETLLHLEKKRLNDRNNDHNIRMLEADIAEKYFTNRNDWTKILVKEYGLIY